MSQKYQYLDFYLIDLKQLSYYFWARIKCRLSKHGITLEFWKIFYDFNDYSEIEDL